MQETWLSILDYVRYKKISISTVRRYIKAERVKYKLEDGKYFIMVPNYNPQILENNIEKELIDYRFENSQLKNELRDLKEEISELKMRLARFSSPTESTTVRDMSINSDRINTLS